MIGKSSVTYEKYSGGENAVFSNDGKSVSVCRTDSGLFDVQGDDGQIKYTGTDAEAAAQATQTHLQGDRHQ